MGASGAESLNVAAGILMGQTEAPLTIRPYLSKAEATQPEPMTIMTSGMAHVWGIHNWLFGHGIHRAEIARLGIRAMLAGTPANLMSASIVGMLLR